MRNKMRLLYIVFTAVMSYLILVGNAMADINDFTIKLKVRLMVRSLNPVFPALILKLN